MHFYLYNMYVIARLVILSEEYKKFNQQSKLSNFKCLFFFMGHNTHPSPLGEAFKDIYSATLQKPNCGPIVSKLPDDKIYDILCHCGSWDEYFL